MVGMKGSKNIIAINKDAEAPIFSIADLGIVGDVHKVLPKLIEALKARGSDRTNARGRPAQHARAAPPFGSRVRFAGSWPRGTHPESEG